LHLTLPADTGDVQLLSCAIVLVMTNPTVVTRDIELDVDAADAWALIRDGDGWAAWLVDEASIDVEAGATGSVTDDGEARHVEVIAVDDGRSVEFVWWPAGTDEQASSVTVTVDPIAPGATMVRIVESFPPRASLEARRGAATRWEARALCAWTACLAPSLV
jgi:hypothetical protein